MKERARNEQTKERKKERKKEREKERKKESNDEGGRENDDDDIIDGDMNITLHFLSYLFFTLFLCHLYQQQTYDICPHY